MKEKRNLFREKKKKKLSKVNKIFIKSIKILNNL
jgi:hypothetical protein